MGVGGQRHAPATLPPVKRTGTHCIGDWVGTRTRLKGQGKISPPPGLDAPAIQPVTSRYTSYAIPAHTHWFVSKLCILQSLCKVKLLKNFPIFN